MSDLLTADEVADELGIHVATVHKWLKRGKLQGSKVNMPIAGLRGGWRIPSSEVDRILRENGEIE